jgi:hypothetical protein
LLAICFQTVIIQVINAINCSTTNATTPRKKKTTNTITATPKRLKNTTATITTISNEVRRAPIEGKILEESKNTDDEDDLFGRSIGNQLKKLQSGKKAKAKQLIRELLHKVEFDK